MIDDDDRITPVFESGTTVRELLRRLWQPIETAPKDGDMFMVGWEERPDFTPDTGFYSPDGVLCLGWSHSPSNPPPTHWMPLPGAPE